MGVSSGIGHLPRRLPHPGDATPTPSEVPSKAEVRMMVFDRLRDQFAAELGSEGIAVLSLDGSRVVPVRYRTDGLALDCLLPRWLDRSAWLEQPIGLVTLPSGKERLRWLEIQGTATPSDSPVWLEGLPQHSHLVTPSDLYQLIRIQPSRIHRFDEAAGWGAQATLDL